MAEGDKRAVSDSAFFAYGELLDRSVRVYGGLPAWTWEAVAARLKEAARTLQTMPTDKPKGYRAMWPDAPHDARTAYGYYGDPLNLYKRERQMPDVRFTPEPGAIDRMDECLGWLHWLSKERGMIVEAISRGVRTQTLVRKVGMKAHTIRREYRMGCREIARRLNNC